MNRLLLLLFLFLSATAVRGQYVTHIALNKNQFLTGEPVVAEVTIINRSGADVIVGGHGAKDWLHFAITESTGRTLPPVSIGSEEPLTLRAGGTTKHKVEISGGYSTADLGVFHIVANVFHPISGQFYASNRERLTITDAKPNLFDQPFGVPEGFRNAGRPRRYQVILFRELNILQLYCRITDEGTGAYLSTFLLGPVNMVTKPQISIDTTNRLHVFFLAQPHIYCHAIVNPDGKIHRRNYYRDDEGNRPTLVMGGASGAQVYGGVPFDPAAPPVDTGKPLRKASERPPGL